MNVAEVKIWGTLAGAVAWSEKTELASFDSEIIGEINDKVNDWQSFAKEVNVAPLLRNSIAKTILNLNQKT